MREDLEDKNDEINQLEGIIADRDDTIRDLRSQVKHLLNLHNESLNTIAARDRQITKNDTTGGVPILLGVIREVERLLTNLQPHIPQACYKDRQQFIDNYVDPALEILRSHIPEKSR